MYSTATPVPLRPPITTSTHCRAGTWTNATLAKIFLDACSSAGVSVLWNVGADTLARAMAGIVDKKTNRTNDAASLRRYLVGNVSMVRDHPAIAGYYACDDCCHMPVLDEYGPVEYQALAQVKTLIRSLDKYRLMFGTIGKNYW